MEEKEITTAIEDLIKHYNNDTNRLYPSYAPNQARVLELVDLMTNSKFRDCQQDAMGANMVFYNIVNLPVDVASKMLDIDTKHVQLRAEDWASYWPAFFKTKEFQMWMKETYFGKFLNQIVYNWPKYGDLFVKKVGKEVKWIPPHNIMAQIDARSIDDTLIVEKHEYATIEAFKADAEESGWENYEDILDKAEEITVYESYFPKEKGKNYFITILEPKPRILAQSRKDKNPYKHLKWIDIPGRLYAKSRVEELFEPQIYLNRIANYKAEGLHWSSKHIFQSRDSGLPKNLLEAVENGEVLITNDEINPVVNEERNLTAYNQEENRWQTNAMRNSFTQEPLTGGRAPAGTPLGSTALQTRLASNYYEQKKEDLAVFLKEIIWDWILPQFESENRKEHKILMRNIISGNDHTSEQYFNAVVQNEVNRRKLEQFENGVVPTPEQEQMLKGIVAEEIKNEEVPIKRGEYDNLKHKLEIQIVGESVDTESKMTTLQTIMQIVGSNPQVLQNPTTRRILEASVNLTGYNPKDIFPEETPGITNQLQQMAGGAGGAGGAERGGSLSAPKIAQSTPKTTQKAINI